MAKTDEQLKQSPVSQYQLKKYHEAVKDNIEILVQNAIPDTLQDTLEHAEKHAANALQEAQRAADALNAFAEGQGLTANEVVNATNMSIAMGSGTIPQFNEDVLYKLGELVVYNGELYRFTALHQPGAWLNDTDTVKTSIYAELQDLRNPDYETVKITINKEDGDPDDIGNNISIRIKEFDVTTDDSVSDKTYYPNKFGEVTDTIKIKKGNYYKIYFSQLAGYSDLSTLTITANRGVREVNVTYLKANKRTYEEITVLINYIGDATTKPNRLNFRYRGIDHYIPIVDNQCIAQIPKGENYSIRTDSDNSVGFIRKPEIFLEAVFDSRIYRLSYTGATEEYMFILKDGTAKALNDTVDKNDIFGIIIATSDLRANDACFFVNVNFFKTGHTLSEINGQYGNWLRSDFNAYEIGANSRYKGDSNTTALYQYYTDQGNVDSIFQKIVDNSDLTLGSITYKGFVGAYNQFAAIRATTEYIRDVLNSIFDWTTIEWNTSNKKYQTSNQGGNYIQDNSVTACQWLFISGGIGGGGGVSQKTTNYDAIPFYPYNFD